LQPTVATTSAVISFAEKLEDSSSSFYEELAQKFAENKETFSSFAQESKKNKLLVTRTYRETITDAIEACYSFEGFTLSDYDVVPVIGKTRIECLKNAIELEDKAIGFYADAAERSKSLLATIPMAFRRVAQTRKNRKLALEALVRN
jgi:rubrerythrin